MQYKLIASPLSRAKTHEENVNKFLQKTKNIEIHTIRTWKNDGDNSSFYTEILYWEK